MLTREQKREIVKNLHEKFNRSQGVIVTTFKGFTAIESNEIRKKIKLKGGEFRVFKNNLIRIAEKDTPAEGVSELVEGPTALVIAYEDLVEVAKVLKEFVKDRESLKIRGFVLNKKVYDEKTLEELVKLPSREVLLAQLLGTMQAPISGFVGVLAAILRNFLYVLKAIEQKKQEEGK